MKVYGIIGWKNAGKTGLMERLVADITARGYSVSTVKHVHHDVDLDQPGKDTFRHRAAGARQVVLASARRHAILTEHRDAAEPELASILAQLAPVDLVLVEGYKRDTHPKIEVMRLETGQPLLQPGDRHVRAVATDAALPPLSVPVLDLNDTAAIADFILCETGLARGLFDTVVVVDWSAAGTPSPRKPSANAIWIGVAGAGGESTSYHPTRAAAEAALTALLDTEAAAGRRVLTGFDFALGYPAGFAARLTGHPLARALWDWMADHLADDVHNANDRFALADRINAQLGGPDQIKGPFWGNGLTTDLAHLPRKMAVDFAALHLARRRLVETRVPTAQEVWKLSGAGSVGGQVLTGLPMIARLARRPGCTVWPFDAPTGSLVLAEVYPSLLANAVRVEGRRVEGRRVEGGRVEGGRVEGGRVEGGRVTGGPIKDQVQVRLLARALFRLARSGGLAKLLHEIPDWPGRQEEGWILGAGFGPALQAALE